MMYALRRQSAVLYFCAFLFLMQGCTSSEYVQGPWISEKNTLKQYFPDVRVLLNSPSQINTSLPSILILYALPNGNSIEMTYGKSIAPGDDWHFDIQHIAAQVRWVRNQFPATTIHLAYLENSKKSWPAWRREHGYHDMLIRNIVDDIILETGSPDSILLAGHSGGGSFITGFINAHDSIPDLIKRIIYLDANYSYDDSLAHGKKLMDWLSRKPDHNLMVIAYDDREITWQGKKVVSPTGGTFRATHRMLAALEDQHKLQQFTDSTITQFFGYNGRARYIIHSNPDTLILHTVLVEKNGFIHSLLFNTPFENKAYTFFGPRAYTSFIESSIPWTSLP